MNIRENICRLTGYGLRTGLVPKEDMVYTVNRLLELIKTVNENHALRISTGVLNEVLIEATAMQQPPADKGRQLRLYYMTQVSVKPPTFVIFVNERELFHFSYRRYIENQLREAFGFVGTPIHFIVREKGDKD